MARHFFLIVFFTFISFCTWAQKGNNALSILVEGGYAGDRYKTGYGVFMKGSYGVGEKGQLTLMAGVSKFRVKNLYARFSSITRLVPFLAGYKRHFNNFYIEPQLGYGEVGGKLDIGGDYARPSLGAFFWAFGAGIDVKRFEFGLRLQGTRTTGNASAGLWKGKLFQYVGLHAGYTIFGKK